SRAYYNAFQIYVIRGDLVRASLFARTSYEANVVYHGEDCPEPARTKESIEHPEAYVSFGTSERWDR
ncbi:uncharacterized protein BCR38DRAFT_296450, partial [Pseudomassariella vexata]